MKMTRQRKRIQRCNDDDDDEDEGDRILEET